MGDTFLPPRAEPELSTSVLELEPLQIRTGLGLKEQDKLLLSTSRLQLQSAGRAGADFSIQEVGTHWASRVNSRP